MDCKGNSLESGKMPLSLKQFLGLIKEDPKPIKELNRGEITACTPLSTENQNNTPDRLNWD